MTLTSALLGCVVLCLYSVLIRPRLAPSTRHEQQHATHQRSRPRPSWDQGLALAVRAVDEHGLARRVPPSAPPVRLVIVTRLQHIISRQAPF